MEHFSSTSAQSDRSDSVVAPVRERPILFSAPMVRAILDGRKTQTRRIVKPQPDYIESSGRWRWPLPKRAQFPGCCTEVVTASREWWEYAPIEAYPYRPGDRLWVRESYARFTDPVLYLADGRNPVIKYRSGRFMPREASRITLEVVNVRVERLQDISETDAQAEGARFVDLGLDKWGNPRPGWSMEDPHPNNSDACLGSARFAFGNLWNKINGAGAWDKNPWVWVIEFKHAGDGAR